MASNRFSESHGIVPAAVSGGIDYDGGTTFESINMAKYNHVTLIIVGNASVAGNGILTISGGATDGVSTAAITFTYRYSSANAGATSADVLGTAATSAALTITGTSLVNRMLICEWDAQDMVVSNVSYQFATPVLDATGTAGSCTGVYILSEPRYAEAVMDSAVS